MCLLRQTFAREDRAVLVGLLKTVGLKRVARDITPTLHDIIREKTTRPPDA
jgi:hypothetical protein